MSLIFVEKCQKFGLWTFLVEFITLNFILQSFCHWCFQKFERSNTHVDSSTEESTLNSINSWQWTVIERAINFIMVLLSYFGGHEPTIESMANSNIWLYLFTVLNQRRRSVQLWARLPLKRIQPWSEWNHYKLLTKNQEQVMRVRWFFTKKLILAFSNSCWPKSKIVFSKWGKEFYYGQFKISARSVAIKMSKCNFFLKFPIFGHVWTLKIMGSTIFKFFQTEIQKCIFQKLCKILLRSF